MRRDDDGPLPSPQPNNLPLLAYFDDDDPSRRRQGQEGGGAPLLAAAPHDREGDGDADADADACDGDDATTRTRTTTTTKTAAAEATDVGFRVGIERDRRARGIATMVNKSAPTSDRLLVCAFVFKYCVNVPTFRTIEANERSNY